MLHASAAFKGGDIQNFWEGGRALYGETYHFMGELITHAKAVCRFNCTKEMLFCLNGPRESD